MERRLDVRTGESIAIRYELAGLGSRFIAVAIDLAIQLGVVLAIVMLLLALAHPIAHALALLDVSAKTLAVFGWTALTLASFVLFFGYFIIFELAWSGRTPGKRVMGLRVMRDAGFPLDIGAAVVRNLIRAIEFAIFFYAVSAIVVVMSRESKRLGDFAAGTIVVRDRRYEAADLNAYLARETPADDGLDAADRRLVERFVARREALEPVARRRLAAQIAQLVRPKLRASFAHLDDEALLEHLGRGVTQIER